MRRLEQIDQPARVIAFPRNMRLENPADHGHRVSPGWVAIAAAAGLVLGVVGTQVTSHYLAPKPTVAPLATQMAAATTAGTGIDRDRAAAIAKIDQDVMGRTHLEGLEAVDQITPTSMPENDHTVVLAALTSGGPHK
jgi:uncharacterized protein YqfA (UPF0365 family)